MNELKPWLDVNGLIVKTEEAFDIVMNQLVKYGIKPIVKEVERTDNGHVLTVNDPMEQ